MLVLDNLCVEFSQVYFHTDSKVVLGYINNQTRRFYTYVSNRVHKIRQVSSPTQWRYVCSDKNPADVGSRECSPVDLESSMWLQGPEFLKRDIDTLPEFFPLVDPRSDTEVRKCTVVTMATSIDKKLTLGSSRFESYSSWYKLVVAVGILIHIVLSFKKVGICRGWHICTESHSLDTKARATIVILNEVQYDSFKDDIDALMSSKSLGTNSALSKLDPYIEESTGLLRVGGRLGQSSLPYEEKHPIILHKSHYVTKLLIRHFHESVFHQGRTFTEGAVRQGGYWIVGAKRAISSLIFDCVTCKKLRGKFERQKMADLPSDRTEPCTAFSYVGVDVFGPWQVISRKTRSSQASAKRWAVLFTCLTIRAVHIEVVDEMTSSAFINALRRFVAIRGSVKIFRSDRGTNFVGSTDSTGVNVINVEDGQVKGFLNRSGTQWIFNAPHSSHMGGVWERMIGVSRPILESMLSKVHNLTHDVLVTLMAEVSAIINARPIVPVSTDSDCPQVLSPSALLNMKLNTDQQSVDDQSMKILYKDQWKRVQYLADQFWLRWSKEFLHSLQSRLKWQNSQPPLQLNDVVLLKDNELARNYWPLGRVSKLFPSSDGKIRKVELCVIKGGKEAFYIRPIVDTVLLVRY